MLTVNEQNRKQIFSLPLSQKGKDHNIYIGLLAKILPQGYFLLFTHAFVRCFFLWKKRVKKSLFSSKGRKKCFFKEMNSVVVISSFGRNNFSLSLLLISCSFTPRRGLFLVPYGEPKEETKLLFPIGE